MNNEQPASDNLSVLYQESGELARKFLDIRYQVFARFFLSAGFLALSAAGLYQYLGPSRLISIPLIVAAVSSLFMIRFDKHAGVVIWDCCEVGAKLEKELAQFEGINTVAYRKYAGPDKPSATKTFKMFYFSSAMIFLVLSFWCTFFPEKLPKPNAQKCTEQETYAQLEEQGHIHKKL